MGAKFEIEFFTEGFRQVLTSAEVKGVLEELANGICDKANANVSDPESDGFAVETKISTKMKNERWLAFVYAQDHGAYKAESEDKALTRAMG